MITQRLPVIHGPGPDFLLIQASQVIFLSVSKATPQDAVRMQQPDLFGGETNRVGEAEETTLATFVDALSITERLPTAVLFPNLSAKQMLAAPTGCMAD